MPGNISQIIRNAPECFYKGPFNASWEINVRNANSRLKPSYLSGNISEILLDVWLQIHLDTFNKKHLSHIRGKNGLYPKCSGLLLHPSTWFHKDLLPMHLIMKTNHTNLLSRVNQHLFEAVWSVWEAAAPWGSLNRWRWSNRLMTMSTVLCWRGDHDAEESLEEKLFIDSIINQYINTQS